MAIIEEVMVKVTFELPVTIRTTTQQVPPDQLTGQIYTLLADSRVLFDDTDDALGLMGEKDYAGQVERWIARRDQILMELAP